MFSISDIPSTLPLLHLVQRRRGNKLQWRKEKGIPSFGLQEKACAFSLLFKFLNQMRRFFFLKKKIPSLFFILPQSNAPGENNNKIWSLGGINYMSIILEIENMHPVYKTQFSWKPNRRICFCIFF